MYDLADAYQEEYDHEPGVPCLLNISNFIVMKLEVWILKTSQLSVGLDEYHLSLNFCNSMLPACQVKKNIKVASFCHKISKQNLKLKQVS